MMIRAFAVCDTKVHDGPVLSSEQWPGIAACLIPFHVHYDRSGLRDVSAWLRATVAKGRRSLLDDADLLLDHHDLFPRLLQDPEHPEVCLGR